ncbi:MAG: hypothetical protein Q8O30_10845 [Candidatus Omnitrophota bacterium]|nr:hypothetical protein [Candidatus Omnitrophota bacterium]
MNILRWRKRGLTRMVIFVRHLDVATTLRYYVDVALAIGSQTTAIWFVFPEDLEEAAEMLAQK